MNDCLFCKIISGEIPSEKIRETKHTYAFLDINPVHPGHTLVVPKEHSLDIFEISPESWMRVMKEVHTLAPVIKEATGADGINIIMNNRRSAGQLVDHTHVHIIPRYADDGLKGLPQHPYAEGEIEATREKIIALLN